MPGTPDEMANLANRVDNREYDVDEVAVTRWTWDDGSQMCSQEWHDLMALVICLRGLRNQWENQNREQKQGQRRALRLLRSLLSLEQREKLRRSGEVLVQGSLGNMYRLNPHLGHAERVIRHGSRWFIYSSFCLHDQGERKERMPPADLTVGHMLLLISDEAEFLSLANETVHRPQLWNRHYLGRLARARRERQAFGMGFDPCNGF